VNGWKFGGDGGMASTLIDIISRNGNPAVASRWFLSQTFFARRKRSAAETLRVAAKHF
jgi:hypothetical protein